MSFLGTASVTPHSLRAELARTKTPIPVMNEVTNVLKYALCLLSATSLLACAANPPEPAMSPQPITEQQADAEVKQAVVEREAEQRALSTDPTFPSVEMFSRDGVQEALQPVAKLCAAKDYDGAATELKQHLHQLGRGRGAVDYRLQAFALNGHAQFMMGQMDASERSYRRIISLWGQPRSMARSIRKQSKTPAEGDMRVALAMDAFGEALFSVADKRRESIDRIALPYYGGGSEPSDVKQYLAKDVAVWLRARKRAVARAESEYAKVAMIKPETPGRWAVAATSRIAALHAKTAYELRAVLAPAAWDAKGDSPHTGAQGQPLSFEKLRESHVANITKLAGPAEDKARKLYTDCVSLAQEHSVDDAFSRSCKGWLKADAARR